MTEYKVFKGVKVKVLAGDTNVGKTFEVSSSDPLTVGTSDIEFIDITPSIVECGIVSPSTPPLKAGNIYIDTVLKDVYVSAGATAIGDWIKIT